MAHDFETLWGAIPYPAFIIGAEDQIIAANGAAEEFGAVSVRQMCGKQLSFYLGKDSPVLEVITQVRREGAPVARYFVTVRWQKLIPETHNVHVAHFGDSSDEVLVFLHPKGNAARMDQRPDHRSAARTVSGMASMLAHEIRNPLAGISGAAQLIEMELKESERELTGLIQTETARIGGLVDRMEQFGDLRPAQRMACNIHTVLDRACRAAQVGFAKHAGFQLLFDPSLPPVSADPDQLSQVFLNLLKNAAEALPSEGGRITVATAYKPGVKIRHPGGSSESVPIQITIRDNGSGIPDALIREIFDPFVSSKVNGTGLGLSLVSKIVADHGGLLECDSEPGRTEFLLRLPVWRGESGVGD